MSPLSKLVSWFLTHAGLMCWVCFTGLFLYILYLMYSAMPLVAN